MILGNKYKVVLDYNKTPMRYWDSWQLSFVGKIGICIKAEEVTEREGMSGHLSIGGSLCWFRVSQLELVGGLHCDCEKCK